MRSKKTVPKRKIHKEPNLDNLGLFIFVTIELFIIFRLFQSFKNVVLAIAIIFLHLFSLLFIWSAKVSLAERKKSKVYFLGFLFSVLIFVSITLLIMYLGTISSIGFPH